MTPTTQVTAVHPHRSNYPNPISFASGDPLLLGKRDTQYPGWIWVTTPSGNQGWAPEVLLDITSPSSAVATETYTAFELNTEPGERLRIHKSIAGWHWVENEAGQLGWVPADTVLPSNTVRSAPTPNEPIVKVCPVVTSVRHGRRHILVFRHPTAGIQLVKGTLEPVEDPLAGAVRELAEESGVTAVHHPTYLGAWPAPLEPQLWHLVHCHADPLPNTWTHFTTDGGGHTFTFFWHPLDAPPTSDWYPLFTHALTAIRHALAQ